LITIRGLVPTNSPGTAVRTTVKRCSILTTATTWVTQTGSSCRQSRKKMHRSAATLLASKTSTRSFCRRSKCQGRVKSRFARLCNCTATARTVSRSFASQRKIARQKSPILTSSRKTSATPRFNCKLSKLTVRSERRCLATTLPTKTNLIP